MDLYCSVIFYSMYFVLHLSSVFYVNIKILGNTLEYCSIINE